MNPHEPSLVLPRGIRRPDEADREFYHQIHGDPELYQHAPWAMQATARQRDESFDAVLAEWSNRGFDYGMVMHPKTGEPAGFAGVRGLAADRGNLYFRLRSSAHGMGLGTRCARAWVAWMTEHHPHVAITACARTNNPASLATLRRSGLIERGQSQLPGDPPGAPPSVAFAAPTFTTHTTPPGNVAIGEAADLWHRVNAAGGAVGFTCDATPAQTLAATQGAMSRVSPSHSVWCALLHPDGQLLAMAWVDFSPREPGRPDRSHAVWVRRLQVDPDHRGRGYGDALLAGLHGVARRGGAHLVFLGYRSGAGLAAFYERHGYAQVGRDRGIMRIPSDPPGIYRDEVTMRRDLADPPPA